MIVRPARLSDAAAVAAVYAPFVTGSYATFEQDPPTPDDMAGRMSGGLPWLVAETGGEVVGYAYAAPHNARAAYRWSVNTSVYVARPGQGTGRRLYDALLPLLADHGLRRAFALVTEPNPASVALHEATGFARCGVLPSAGHKAGAWRDVGVWSRPLADAPDEPDEPRRWHPAG